jgi:hypothetical protein
MSSTGCSITTRDWRSKRTLPTPAASRITCSDFATCSVSASPHACATSRSASSTCCRIRRHRETPRPANQRGPACGPARMGAHRSDRRLRVEHRRAACGRLAPPAEAAAIASRCISSLIVRDVAQSEHFRVAPPIGEPKNERFACVVHAGIRPPFIDGTRANDFSSISALSDRSRDNGRTARSPCTCSATSEASRGLVADGLSDAYARKLEQASVRLRIVKTAAA